MAVVPVRSPAPRSSLETALLHLDASALLFNGANGNDLHLLDSCVSRLQVIFSCDRGHLLSEHIFTWQHTHLISSLQLFDLLELVLETKVCPLQVLDVLVLAFHELNLLVEGVLKGLLDLTVLLKARIHFIFRSCWSFSSAAFLGFRGIGGSL